MSGVVERRRPMPAFEDTQRREDAIEALVRALLELDPGLFDDVEQLTQPPAIDDDAYVHGLGLYGYDQTRRLWDLLATSVAATADEIERVLQKVRSAA
jgi:hypothetical protein